MPKYSLVICSLLLKVAQDMIMIYICLLLTMVPVLTLLKSCLKLSSTQAQIFYFKFILNLKTLTGW